MTELMNSFVEMLKGYCKGGNMNKEFEFEIQACIKRKSFGETADEARQFIINNLALYADSLVADAVVSDGEEV
jgi:uncharacterized protein YbjQ (UPF0145 family)